MAAIVPGASRTFRFDWLVVVVVVAAAVVPHGCCNPSAFLRAGASSS